MFNFIKSYFRPHFIKSYGIDNPVFISQSTDKAIHEYSRRLIREVAEEEGVSPFLIQAISERESGLNFTAIHYEPQLHSQKWFIRACAKYDRDPDDPFNASAYGLMQILAVHCFEFIQPSDSVLFLLGDPKLALRIAVDYLKGLLDHYPLAKAISAYNAGGYPVGWNHIVYVIPVLERTEKLEKEKED